MKSGLAAAFLWVFILSAPQFCPADNPKVVIGTSLGDMAFELYEDLAPITVENFLHYVNTDFYDSTVIHRVDNNPDYSIIQGGKYYIENYQVFAKNPDRGPIINESSNGLSNLRGTIAMARTSDPNSATCEFFVNHRDNVLFDKANYPDGYGYCVFGKLILGTDTLDAIASSDTNNIGGPLTQFPIPPVYVYGAYVAPDGFWLKADLNYDGSVDEQDLDQICENWLSTVQLSDLQVSGAIDFQEFAQIAARWRWTSVWNRFSRADIDNSGRIDFLDFAILAQDWDKTGSELRGDLNLDGTVNYLDLTYLSQDWLETEQ